MPWSNARPLASTTARGYGKAHRLARAAAAARHTPADPCVRCGHALGPMGPWLHLDHMEDRSGYLGFAHKDCNLRAGAKKGRRIQKAGKSKRVVLDRW
jgi:hypothetical protein